MGGCNLKSKEEEEIGGCENVGGCGSRRAWFQDTLIEG